MRQVFVVPFVLVPLFALQPPGEPACTCEENKLRSGWCGKCKVGHVAAVAIDSEVLFEALDAHGHRIDVDSMKCESCRKALASDGFCTRCNWGFVDQQLYHSKLTYFLAKGKTKVFSSIKCARCRKNTLKPGWCDSCKVGRVGNVAFEDKKMFEQASREHRKLLAAVEIARRCEICAVALFTDAKCPTCKKTYKDGKEVITPPP
ncbi:MAG: hypothetical protein O7D91_05120 [Planctomycetota bacterium]|nr:hypothetical protein [Planctomycetota bacterium]